MTDKEILQDFVDTAQDNWLVHHTFSFKRFLFISVGRSAEETALPWIGGTDKKNAFRIAITWIIRYLLRDEPDEAKKINDFVLANYDITADDLKDAIKKISNIYSEELATACKYYWENK